MTLAYLYNPRSPLAERRKKEMLFAARALGRQIITLEARNERDFEEVFAILVQNGAGALQVQAASFFINYRERLLALAMRHRIPTIYQVREFVADGGLMSYGASQADTVRLGGKLRRTHSQGPKTGRSAVPKIDEIRAGHQPQDRKSTRSLRAAAATRACR